MHAITMFVCTVSGAQTLYTFQGSGNWSDTANWLNRQVPPTLLGKLDTIVIDPSGTNECILDVQQFMPDSSHLIVKPNKKFKLMEGLASSAIKVSDKLHVIDTAQMRLVSDSAMLSQGVYEFISDQAIPTIAVGDFIVGTTGSGYLCKVTSVSYQRPDERRPQFFRALFNTVKAKLMDVLLNGGFTIKIPVDNSFQGGNSGPLVVTLPSVTYNNGPLELAFSEGRITLNPNWFMALQSVDEQIKYFEMSTRNSSFDASFRLTARASGEVQIPEQRKVLKTFSKLFYLQVGPLPITIELSVDIVFKYSASVSASIQKTALFNINNTLNLGVKYSNGNWSPITEASFDASYTREPITGQANANVTASLGPQFNAKIYSAIGPYFWAGLAAEIDENFAVPSNNWDLTLNGFIKTDGGVDPGPFSAILPAYNLQPWQSRKIKLFRTPDSVMKVSGDNQSALFNEYVANPIRVLVVDNFGYAQSNVPVYFKVTDGEGRVDEDTVLSNSAGYAETRWQLGSKYGVKQTVEAYIQKADGSTVSTPVKFTAKTPMLVGNWRLRSFANGVLPGNYVNVYDSFCPNILRYRYTELVDNINIDSTTFTNYNEERVIANGISWDPQTCAVTSTGAETDSLYQTTTAGTYTVTNNNTVTYFVEGNEVASYSFYFISFDRIKADENEYDRQ